MSYKMKALTITLIVIIFFAIGSVSTYFYINHLNTKSKQPDDKSVKIVSKLETTEDSVKFKSEYEDLNEILDENGNSKYMPINVPENNGIKYATINDIESLFNGNSGVVYFGFPACPWCRNAVPVLIEAASESQIDKIYYMNVKEIRDKKSLDDNGNIVTESEGTEEYRKLLEFFGDSLDSYEGLNDESVKRIYAPTVFFIKDGKVVSKHTGTLDSQENPKISLTPDEKLELKNIYKDGFKKITENEFVCDEDRNC